MKVLAIPPILIRKCLVSKDGKINYYLNPNDETLKEDGTPAILDGSDGQVMEEIPSYYRKIDSFGNKIITLKKPNK
jgi:hypothetical protein